MLPIHLGGCGAMCYPSTQLAYLEAEGRGVVCYPSTQSGASRVWGVGLRLQSTHAPCTFMVKFKVRWHEDLSLFYFWQAGPAEGVGFS